MGAPKGNRFWELRSKHGVDKLFVTPDLMWEAAAEYFVWCEENPLMETVVQKRKISRDEEIIEMVEVPKMRAFTLQGLTSYLGVNTVYFSHFEANLKDKESEINKGFCQVITRIREVIYNQKFSGAASGFLNANIIARDLGLADKKDLDIRKVGADAIDEEYVD